MQLFCGNQVSSWHGTTVQAVQPIPSLCEESTVAASISTQSNSVLAEHEVHVCATVDQSQVLRDETTDNTVITRNAMQPLENRVHSSPKGNGGRICDPPASLHLQVNLHFGKFKEEQER